VAKHIRPNARRIRSPANAERICELIEEGKSLPQIAAELGCRFSAITNWVSDDAKNGGLEIAVRYARAMDARCEWMAEELLRIADDRSFAGRPDANALVTQQRLAVDTRKWLLSKMMPRKYGERVEVAGDPAAPVVTRIELVAVHPKLSPPTIEHDDDDRE
jgi:hypothetical protein